MRPSKEYENEVYEGRQRHKIFLVAGIIFCIIAGAMLSIKYYPVTSIIIIIVSLINIIRSYLWLKEDNKKLRDLTDSAIELNDNSFYCTKANERDSFEECDIKYNDVEKIVESLSRGSCGFYIYIKEDNNSSIFTNHIHTDRRVFYVNGHGYDTNEFRNMYLDLVSRLNGDAVIVGTSKQKAWFLKNEKQEIIMQLMPFLSLILIFAVHTIVSIL